MPNISLTTFVDFVLKLGTPRITCVKNAKEMYEKDYNPAFDFYKPLREAIIQMHRQGQPKQTLEEVLVSLKDPKKIQLYPPRVQAYQQWLGRKNIEWLGCDSQNWGKGELIVRVNPELGIRIDGTDHLIKIYFKDEKLTKPRIETMLCLIKESFAEIAPNATPSILDVLRGRLYEFSNVNKEIKILLDSEAIAFLEIWNRL